MNKDTRLVLITGGAQGIGKGIAAYLLARDWRVVICDRDIDAGERCLADLAPGQADRLHFITGQNIVVDGGMTRKMIYED